MQDELCHPTERKHTLASKSLYASLPLPHITFLEGIATGTIIYFFFTWLSHQIVPSIATSTFQNNLSQLDSNKQRLFHSLLPSTLHAILQILGTAHIFFANGPSYLNDNHNHVTHFETNLFVPYGLTGFGPAFFMGLLVGYLMSDYLYFGTRALGILMSLHHLAASASWTYAATARCMQWYASFVQFCEFSTIFVNLRQVLLTAGYASSSWELTLAGLVLFVTFGAVRIVPLPKLVYGWMMRDFYVLEDFKGRYAALFCSVFFVIHVCMQCYWFSLMLNKFVFAMFHTK
mmetsp:Transcript_14144/g.19357  ORF Transcript_14144/g.19357 Transcript_14144/m.19357 type:complete len:289 (-) Transcript_14144:68-934(-)